MSPDTKQLWSGFAQILRTRSGVLTPILWPSIILPLAFGEFAYLFKESAIISGILISAAILSPISLFVGFFYFAFNDPDRLQSEKYQLQKLGNQTVMQGKIGPKIISDEPLQISSNPDVQSEPYLPDNKDEEEEKGDEK